MKPYLVIEKRKQILIDRYNIDNENVDYNKISKLDYARTTLKSVSILSGALFVVDLIIPDPVFLIDEATLATISGALKIIDSIVLNKIEDLVKEEKLEISLDEISTILDNTTDIIKKIKK